MIYFADQVFIYFVKLTRLLTKSPEIPSPIINKKSVFNSTRCMFKKKKSYTNSRNDND